MPKHYASGKLKVIVDLSSKDDSFVFKQWTNKNNIKICEEYGHPKIKMVYRIENEADPESPWVFYISDKDAYQGGISCKQSGKTFEFTLDGKFKFDVNKDVPAKLSGGKTAIVEGVSYLRQQCAEGCVVEEDSIQFSKKAL